MKINHRKQSFVTEYIQSGNATEAALKAGYSKKTAYSIGQRLLKNVEIMKKVKTHQETATHEAEITLIQVLKEIRNISLNATDDRIKLKAHDMLMKHLGGYMDSFKMLAIMKDEHLEQVAKKLPSWFDE